MINYYIPEYNYSPAYMYHNVVIQSYHVTFLVRNTQIFLFTEICIFFYLFCYLSHQNCSSNKKGIIKEKNIPQSRAKFVSSVPKVTWYDHIVTYSNTVSKVVDGCVAMLPHPYYSQDLTHVNCESI